MLEFATGQVDYGASPEEVQTHFHSCGTINRVTILCDKWTQAPKGSDLHYFLLYRADWVDCSSRYAYVEFASPDLVQNALALNESLFRGRQLSVSFSSYCRHSPILIVDCSSGRS